MGVTKVTLRKRLLPSGKITLYLDFYPPLRDPHSRKYVRHEYLGIYLVNKPRFQSDKDANKEKIAQAEAIRSERELAIIRGQYDFLDKTKLKMDFLAYFKTKLDTKDQKWIRVYDHFSNYCGGVCKMGDITVPFCEGFREYLLNAKQLKHPDKQLAQNSAAGYWSTFRGFLKIAYQEKLLQENVNDYLETIDAVDGRREFLTLEEVRQLAATPCDTPDLKNASLFSCLTGLRISDILALNWSNIVKATDGGWCIRIKTEKTDTSASRPRRPTRRPPFPSPRKPTNSAASPAPDSSSRTSSATTHRSRSRTGSRMPASPNTSPSTASVIPSPPSRSTKAPTYTPSPTCSPTPTSERRRFTPTSWTRARETPWRESR